MKVTVEGTWEEMDYSEIEAWYLSRLMKAAGSSALTTAQRFYTETTKPPGTPMPDIFRRCPTIKGTVTGRIIPRKLVILNVDGTPCLIS